MTEKRKYAIQKGLLAATGTSFLLILLGSLLSFIGSRNSGLFTVSSTVCFIVCATLFIIVSHRNSGSIKRYWLTIGFLILTSCLYAQDTTARDTLRSKDTVCGGAYGAGDTLDIRTATSFKVRSYPPNVIFYLNEKGKRTIYISRSGRRYYYVLSKSGNIYKKYIK